MKIKCERSSAEAKMILFHEIGHYVNNDYLHFDSQSEEYAKECRLYAANNALLDLEIAADAFAAKDLVNDTVSTGFSLLLARVQSMYNCDGFDAEDVKEIETRIGLASQPAR